MAHKDPERRRAYWRGAQRRHRARQREDALGELQSQLRASASAGMGGRDDGDVAGSLQTVRTSAPISRPGADWRSVGRVWVPEIPVARDPRRDRASEGSRPATDHAGADPRRCQLRRTGRLLLAAAEAAGLCVLVQRWIRQRPAAVSRLRRSTPRPSRRHGSRGVWCCTAACRSRSRSSDNRHRRHRNGSRLSRRVCLRRGVRRHHPMRKTFRRRSGRCPPHRRATTPSRGSISESSAPTLTPCQKRKGAIATARFQKLLDTQEDRGMAGKSLEDRAVAMLRTRHKVR